MTYYRAFTDDETTDDSIDKTEPTPVQIDGYQVEFDLKVALMPVEVIASPPTPPAHGNARY
ncbi:hypothetical protein ACAW74_13890 [Fibrella sp. WM1]|uniref:hypothetical protein n=1 Tax=Fibrella musci TaxID=3242485 RepID=UPI003520122A